MLEPSNVSAGTFVAISPELQDVSSDIPLVVLDTLGARHSGHRVHLAGRRECAVLRRGPGDPAVRDLDGASNTWAAAGSVIGARVPRVNPNRI